MTLTFLAIGDMGTGDPDQYQVATDIENIIKYFKKKHLNEIEFITGLGDNIYKLGINSSNDDQFNTKFEIPYRNINKKFYMSLGNHDYSYSNLEPGYQQSPQHQINYSNISKKWVLPSNYYSYSYININIKVDFFVIDTNLDKMNKLQQELQLSYLIHKINESNARWKILYGHHPWRSIQGHGHAKSNLEDYFKKIIKGTIQNTIDLYMCGHDHNKQYIKLKYNNKIRIHLIVCGASGKVNHEPNPTHVNSPNDDFNCYFFSNTLGFVCIKIYKNYMKIYFLNGPNNNVEFSYTIKK